MSQSYFSLGFLFQNYLWKLFTFCGYKGIYSRVCEECEKSVFIQTWHSGDLVLLVEQVASLSCKLTIWWDYTFCTVVLQLSWPFISLHASHVCHFGDLSVTRSNCETPLECTQLEFFTLSHTELKFLHTLTHTTLTLFPPKYRISNC